MALLERATRGMTDLFLSSMLQTGLRLLVIGVLARYLSPEDFGLVAVASMVAVILELEGALGVGPALIQREKVSRTHLATGQSIAILLAVLLGLTLYWSSGALSRLFGSPASEPAMQAMALVIFVRTAASVSEARLFRDLKFRWIAVCKLMAYIVGYAVVGIYAAAQGFGFWSLVFAEIGQAIVIAVLFLILRPPIRSLRFDGAAAKELMDFGVKLSSAKLLRQAIYSIDQAVISRLFGAEALGFYTRAQGTVFRPINILGGIMESVLFPLLSSIQGEVERLKSAYLRGVTVYFLVVAPIVIACAILANEIIFVLLGDGWQTAAVILQLIAAGFFFRTANRLCATILKARGRAGWLLLLQIEHLLTVAGCILIGSRYGIEGVAIAASVAQLVHYAVANCLVIIELGGMTRRLMLAIVAALPALLASAVAGYLAHTWCDQQQLVWLLDMIITLVAMAVAWAVTLLASPSSCTGENVTWVLANLIKSVQARLPFLKPHKRDVPGAA